jgi:hypothetical protein
VGAGCHFDKLCGDPDGVVDIVASNTPFQDGIDIQFPVDFLNISADPFIRERCGTRDDSQFLDP